MQWHAHCSSFLIEPTSSEPGPSNLSVQLWNTLSSGVTKEVKHPVIISFCSVVYDLLLVKVRSVLSGMYHDAEGSGATSQQSTSLCTEPVEVYY